MYPNIVTGVPEATADNQPYILIIWSRGYNVFKSQLQLKASRSASDWFCPVVWPFFKGFNPGASFIPQFIQANSAAP